jgi:hypothetical protein
VFALEYVISFLFAVAAGIACHYKRKEESPNCIAVQLRDSFFCRIGHDLFLPNGIIAYTNINCNIPFMIVSAQKGGGKNPVASFVVVFLQYSL